MEIRFEEKIPVEDYLRLRASVGWLPMAEKQAQNAVGKCFYSLCGYDGDKAISMIRLLWNGDNSAYVADVIVDEAYRGNGIGSTMVKRVIRKLEDSMGEGYTVKLFLMAAEGKETFYEQFGFHTRPYGHSGAGMDQILRK